MFRDCASCAQDARSARRNAQHESGERTNRKHVARFRVDET
jgi:hypothetical protein